jgi:hypothetical protein
VETMKHTTPATARLRFLFLAARIWCHAGRVGVSYSDITRKKGPFNSSWTDCVKSLADWMDLLLSFPRRYVPDSTSGMAHSSLCTRRSTVSSTYRAALEK